MKVHRFTHGLGIALAVAVAAVIPASAQDATTAPAATPDQAQVFNLPTAAPMGEGWYGAASTTTQNAMMARGEPWSNDLVPVRGIARLAVIDGNAGATAGMPAATGTDRLVTGVAQWMNPSDNALYEVRFTGIDPNGPMGGASVMRAMGGDSGVGLSQFPRSMNYVALDGPVQVLRNGQVIASNLRGHMMVTQGIRTADSGRLLDTPSVSPNDMQLHLYVEGSIPGINRNTLYLFWPSATLDLRNLSAPVALLPQEIQVAQSFFGVQGTVAGYRGPVETTGMVMASAPLFMVSLRDRFLARSTPRPFAGTTEMRIRNDSNEPRGFYIQGPGIDQRTNLINPGEEITMQIQLQPGTYRLASFTAAQPTTADYMHWDEISVQAAPAEASTMLNAVPAPAEQPGTIETTPTQ